MAGYDEEAQRAAGERARCGTCSRSPKRLVDRVQVPEAAESPAACLREGDTHAVEGSRHDHGKPNNFAQKGTHRGWVVVAWSRWLKLKSKPKLHAPVRLC